MEAEAALDETTTTKGIADIITKYVTDLYVPHGPNEKAQQRRNHKKKMVEHFKKALLCLAGPGQPTVKQAQNLYEAYKELQEESVENKKCLVVQFPFSRLICLALKTLEIRTGPLTGGINHQTSVYISESGTPTSFAASKKAIKAIKELGLTPNKTGMLVGQVFTDGSFELKKKDLTEEIAEQACLTLEGLTKMWKGIKNKRGNIVYYRHAWRLTNNISFLNARAGQYATKQPGTIWTKTKDAPEQNRLPIPLAMANKLKRKSC